jgi:hypothetical protein
MLLFFSLTPIIAVSITFQVSSSIKLHWEKCKAEVSAVVAGTRTRKPPRKRQPVSTVDSSSQEKVKANPKAKAEEKRKNNESPTKNY